MAKRPSKAKPAAVRYQERPGISTRYRLDREEAELIDAVRASSLDPSVVQRHAFERSMQVLREELNDATSDLPAVPESDIIDLSPFALHSRRILVMSDLHIPFHDTHAVTEAMKAGRQFNVDCVLLNGDVMDNSSLSRHLPDRKQKKLEFKYERDRCEQFLDVLREWFPNALIVYKFGNHENRFDLRLMTQAPELASDERMSLHELLRLKARNIEYVEHWRFLNAGKLNIMHGHEIHASGVYPSRTALLKTIDNVLHSHVHRTSEFSQKRIRGEYLGGWTTGCLCELNPIWHRHNQWNHGYALIEVAADGSFEVTNKRILR